MADVAIGNFNLPPIVVPDHTMNKLDRFLTPWQGTDLNGQDWLIGQRPDIWSASSFLRRS